MESILNNDFKVTKFLKWQFDLVFDFSGAIIGKASLAVV